MKPFSPSTPDGPPRLSLTVHTDRLFLLHQESSIGSFSVATSVNNDVWSLPENLIFLCLLGIGVQIKTLFLVLIYLNKRQRT